MNIGKYVELYSEDLRLKNKLKVKIKVLTNFEN